MGVNIVLYIYVYVDRSESTVWKSFHLLTPFDGVLRAYIESEILFQDVSTVRQRLS